MQQPLSTSVFEFVCPRCAQHIQVESCHGGGWVECPRCRSTVIAPPDAQLVGGYEDLAPFDADDSDDDSLLLELQQLRASLSGHGKDSTTLRGQMERTQHELQAAIEEGNALRDHLHAALADREMLAQRLVNDVARLEAELSTLRNEKTDLTTLLEAAEEFGRGAAERLGELNDLRERYAILSNEHAELARRSDEERALRTELESHVSLLQVQFEESVTHRKSLDAVHHELRASREQLRLLEEQRATLWTNLSERDEELRKLREGRADEFTALTARVDELQAQLNSRDASLAESKASEDVLREETKALHVRVEHLTNQLQGRDRELQEANQRLEVVLAAKGAAEALAAKYERGSQEEEQRLTELRTQRDEAAAELVQAKARIETLERDLRARRETLDEMQREVEKSWKAREEASRRVAELEAETQSTTTKLQEAANAERTYRNIIEQTQHAHSAAQRAMEPLRLERDELKAEVARLREATRAIEQEMEATRNERDGLRTSIEHLESQMEESFEHVRVTESERDAMRMELQATRAGLERTKQHVAVLQSRRDQMREEIARLKQALGLTAEAA